MDVVGVIPARLHSTRLPQKLLRIIFGKTLLQWTWEQARQAHLLDKLIIACDDTRLYETASAFGAETVMTSSEHTSGTDRIAEAVRDIDAGIILNIQADEPAIHPSVIDGLASCMLEDKTLVMATVKKKIDEDEEISNTSVVKVVTDKDGFALYFSRFAIPFFRQAPGAATYYKHIGIYAYTKDFLYTFKNLPYSYLEHAEKLEQLRALEAGHRIKVIETNFDSWGIDTEDDIKKIEGIFSQRGYA